MKYCIKCGKQLPDDALFCSSCGADSSNGQSNAPGQQKENVENKSKSPNESKANTRQDSFDYMSGNNNNTNDYTDQFDADDIAVNKAVSIVAYLGILFFVPLLAAPNSKFAKFHANQGLVFFITSAILSFSTNILRFIVRLIFSPIMGHFSLARSAISVVTSLGIAAIILSLLITGIINAYNGKAKELPIIGKYRLL